MKKLLDDVINSNYFDAGYESIDYEYSVYKNLSFLNDFYLNQN